MRNCILENNRGGTGLSSDDIIGYPPLEHILQVESAGACL